jgi:F-type H+-transporting ATPase subunit delta
MSSEAVARRYSSALADVVISANDADNAKHELAAWAAMFKESDDLRTVFSNPAIPHASKERVLEDLIAKGKPSKSTANFLRVLLRNGRLTELTEINDKFKTELQERSSVVSAEIISARELGKAERDAFAKTLQQLTGRTVNMNFAVDPELIGGVVTRVGSTVYDGSVRTKLENLREQLVNG